MDDPERSAKSGSPQADHQKGKKEARHAAYTELQAEASSFLEKAFDMQSTLSTILFAANGAGVAGVFNALIEGNIKDGNNIVIIAFIFFVIGDLFAFQTFFNLRDFAMSHAYRLKKKSNLKDYETESKDHEISADRVSTKILISMAALVIGGVLSIYSVLPMRSEIAIPSISSPSRNTTPPPQTP